MEIVSQDQDLVVGFRGFPRPDGTCSPSMSGSITESLPSLVYPINLRWKAPSRISDEMLSHLSRSLLVEGAVVILPTPHPVSQAEPPMEKPLFCHFHS
ncbi:unnamed protein product [Pleuronectes platessa]|uniref:Uncharacterized protein n=1 Tax=Pleuronectes platessa TaxID=8262 RepID=A0A9N7YZF5_PLEPL|nr:unnamed protein product [Pleuronectes platessa]